MVINIRIGSKVDAKRLALEEGVQEDDPELFFRGGKEASQKFCETTLAKDQKERDPVRHEAILLLMRTQP